MPNLTLTENLKLQLSPGLVASHDIQPGNGLGLFWDKHTPQRIRDFCDDALYKSTFTNTITDKGI